MSAAKAPPRKAAPGVAGQRRVSASLQPVESPVEKRTKGLLGLAQLGQGLCMGVGLYADAAAIGMHFPAIAPELAQIAEGKTWLMGPIDFLIETGPYAAFVTAVAPLALQIAANHGVIDASRLYAQGVRPPAVLESEMKTQVMQMQANMMREQQKAMEAARQAQQDLEKLLADEAA